MVDQSSGHAARSNAEHAVKRSLPLSTPDIQGDSDYNLLQKANPIAFSTQNFLQLQRTIGNQAVMRMLNANARGLAIQRVFDPETPSTYDDDGGHSYTDHGAQTTETQHKTRLTTGATPSGRNSIPPDGKSSKFASDEMHKKALKQAKTDLEANKSSARGGGFKKGYNNAYSLAGVGISYEMDGVNIKTPQVVCNNFYAAWSIIDESAGTYKLVTLYPRP